ncbi:MULTISPECIES: hypothetical protein [unclassified Roseobacter]|uniref:hypothetical protein n=1 Tax=unclassified Roseobacter TaxID=196798 RepID=UPI0014914325|nr:MULTISPECIES: hypothetical protein [unclassified Roseobacter]NNY51947.1 hypothetical protein [Roseobacter sp. HKCCD8190]NNZ66937.1 hypothetical protein [Roseobacter sp. HKCCD5928]NOB37089.1 hypothetical protein [Roseobacter sp. HKCCD8421]
MTAFNETKGESPATFAVTELWRFEREEPRGKGKDGLTHMMATTETNNLIQPIHTPKRMRIVRKGLARRPILFRL